MRHASCLNPSHITNLASSSESFKQLMNQLVYLKIFPGKTGDKALIQFSNFIRNCVKEEPKKTASFDPKKNRIDDFYNLIFTISHRQTDVDRDFSLNKYLLHCCNMPSQLDRSMKFIKKQARQKNNRTEKVNK